MKTSTIAASALLAAVVVPMMASAEPAPEPKFKAEKCYGVARAANNDCQTAASSCAGTSKRDSQADAWLYVPAGTCTKLVGGSTTPKKG
ncbi:DUF2282 domain-containing protein [Vineibacter terrae]|uniref:BufA1 family periplasmic bufferin-type metallophore n=1 Tax=Vineibacter terrae TaxID=2586908 RepID=UPI002E3372D3|nr:DUF2282 domain-containing protein [Vineibacter terrae]HEX2891431.1 DUF2282 domain-containing protein [Vineibacter terrae]